MARVISSGSGGSKSGETFTPKTPIIYNPPPKKKDKPRRSKPRRPKAPPKKTEDKAPATPAQQGTQHGWWDSQGTFHPTATLEQATHEWRSAMGLSTGGVYQTDAGIVDTRSFVSGAPASGGSLQAAVPPAKSGETFGKASDKTGETFGQRQSLGPVRTPSTVQPPPLVPGQPKPDLATKTFEEMDKIVQNRRTTEVLPGNVLPESARITGNAQPDKRPGADFFAAPRLDLGYEGFEAEDARRRAEIRQQYRESGLSKPQQNALNEAAAFARSIGQTNLPNTDYELEDPLGISPLIRILENRGIAVPEGATPSQLKDILMQAASDPSLQSISPTWVSALEAADLIAPRDPFVDPNAGGGSGGYGGYGSGAPRYNSRGNGGYRGTGRASSSAATLGLINWRI